MADTFPGSIQAPEHIIQASQEALLTENIQKRNECTQRRTKDTVEIETYVHVLADNKTIEGGYVPKSFIKDNIKLVNKAFSRLTSLLCQAISNIDCYRTRQLPI
jgi:hypothetical protein